MPSDSGSSIAQTSEEVTQSLTELAFSARLPADVLAKLSRLASVARFSSGVEFFHEGAKNSNFYLLRSGHVALEVYVPGRGRVRILTLGPGEMLSWSAVVGEATMTASAVALTDVEAITIPGPLLAKTCEVDCEFGYQIMRRLAETLAQRLSATRLQLLDLFADEVVVAPEDDLP